MRRAKAVEMDEQGIAVAAPLKAIVRRERVVLVVGLIESRIEAVEEGGWRGERNRASAGLGAVNAPGQYC